MKKNIIANIIGRFWSILANFLFIPTYIHFLGFESYSIISFTVVIAGLMAVFDAGLTATLSREFARADNSRAEKIRIFKTLESSYYLIIVLSIILLFSLSDIIAHNWLNLNTINPNKVSLFLKIISFDIGFQMLFSFYLGGLLGLEKQVKANLYQVGWGMLRNGFVIIAIWIVPSLETFFIWQAVSTIIFTLLLLLALNKILIGQYRFDFKFNIERSVFKKVWLFAGGMLLISLVASFNTQMDKLAISKILPLESLGYYTIAVSLSMGIMVLVNPISIALLPRFTALYSDKKKDEASALFHKINLFVAILVFSVMAIMSFFAKKIIWIWTGNTVLAHHAYIYVPIVAMSFSMLALATIPYNIAIANGYTKLNNLLGLTSLFVTLPGYWLATRQYGAMGAAVVFCVVQTIITLIYIYIINKKYLNAEKFSTLFIKQMLIPLVLSASIAFGFTFIPHWAGNSRIFSLLWISIAAAVTFCITILILLPINDIKQTFRFKYSLKQID